MARPNWNAHSAFGHFVVTDGVDVWTGSADQPDPASMVALPRGLLPRGTIRAAATNGTHLALSGGRPARSPQGPEDDFPIEGSYEVCAVDLASLTTTARCEADRIGDHIGIVDGHIADWYWFAQGDVLGGQFPMRVNGSKPAYDHKAFNAYDYCSAFAVAGDVMAGTIDYRGLLYLGKPGRAPREIAVPQRFRNPKSFAYLGFDGRGELVLTIRRSRERRAWRLGEGDNWTDLGAWSAPSKAVVEFTGPDGRLVELKESQLPQRSNTPQRHQP